MRCAVEKGGRRLPESAPGEISTPREADMLCFYSRHGTEHNASRGGTRRDHKGCRNLAWTCYVLETGQDQVKSWNNCLRKSPDLSA